MNNSTLNLFETNRKVFKIFGKNLNFFCQNKKVFKVFSKSLNTFQKSEIRFKMHLKFLNTFFKYQKSVQPVAAFPLSEYSIFRNIGVRIDDTTIRKMTDVK